MVVVTVPSRLAATVVTWVMALLLPDMSSTFIAFHVVLEVFVSPFQVKVQFAPSLNESPGPGAVGVGSAITKRKEAKRVVKVKRSILPRKKKEK